MRTRKVIVLSYGVTWQSAFEKIKGEIEEAISDLIIGIEHVGSTSVEGLSAKPCISSRASVHLICGMIGKLYHKNSKL